MEPQFKTLETIFSIAQQDPHPLSYPCLPREIILRQFQDWGVIEEHLHLLQDHGLVVLKHLDTLIINITEAGIEKILAKDFDYQPS